MKTANEFLETAAKTLAERGQTYDGSGEQERSMGRAVAAFVAITGKHLTEAEGWLLLQLVKDVRQWNAPEYHEDSALDCVAYAALKAETLRGAVTSGKPQQPERALGDLLHEWRCSSESESPPKPLDPDVVVPWPGAVL